MAYKTEIEAPENSCQVIITRLFDAPREKVWKAWTDSELLKQWQGPRGYETVFDEFDMRPGGSYRYVQKAPDGNTYAFRGVVHGMYGQEKIVQTFEYEGLPEPGHVAMDTLVLEEIDGGKTKATVYSVFQTPEDRDGMVQSGMEKGVVEGYERLDELLK